MKEAGLAVELLETRHTHNAFQTMPVKTDRNDARRIAELMRLGWFRPVHCKSMSAQETRAMLSARKLIQCKLRDIENSLRGLLRGFGLKVGRTTERSFAARIGHLSPAIPPWRGLPKACWRCMRWRCRNSTRSRRTFARCRDRMRERSCR